MAASVNRRAPVSYPAAALGIVGCQVRSPKVSKLPPQSAGTIGWSGQAIRVRGRLRLAPRCGWGPAPNVALFHPKASTYQSFWEMQRLSAVRLWAPRRRELSLNWTAVTSGAWRQECQACRLADSPARNGSCSCAY